MLKIRREQVEALVRARQERFVEQMVHELLSPESAPDDPPQTDNADLRGTVTHWLAFCLGHGMGDPRSAAAFIRLMRRHGLRGTSDLPSLALEVLSANGVVSTLKLRMLEDVLASEASGT